jgi:AcrR family transcriptional regulator
MEEKKTPANSRGRPREFREDDALDAAMRVFSMKGYQATSLTDLTEGMGINRVSLYSAFGNKEALFLKAMTRYLELGNRRFTECLAAPTAREGIEKLLVEAVLRFTNTDGPGVCFITQGPLSPSEASDETCRFVAEKRSDIELMIKNRLDQGAAAGEFETVVFTADLARYFAVSVQGLALQAQHGGTRAELLRVVDLMMGAIRPRMSWI